MIRRITYETLLSKFNKGKAIVLLGPRQVGKTTLIEACLEQREYLFLNGDDPEIQNSKKIVACNESFCYHIMKVLIMI